MPSVSWLLPVKDGAPYLRETLASLEAQTRRDFAVLAWDNGSSDGSPDELDRWIPRRLPGRVVRGRPLSLASSLAALVEMSETEWCARIDADDIAEPNRLAAQCDYLAAHPDVACLGSRFTAIDRSGRELKMDYPIAVGYAELQDRLLGQNAILHPSVVFRKDAILEAGNYRENHDVAHVEDYDLWLRLSSRRRVESLPERLVRYRVHDKNVTFESMRLGLLGTALDAAWVRNAEAFAGVRDRRVARRIRSRSCRFALPHFLSIARHLGRRDGLATWKRLRRPLFHRFCTDFTSRGDVPTRAFLHAFPALPGDAEAGARP